MEELWSISPLNSGGNSEELLDEIHKNFEKKGIPGGIPDEFQENL